jgi:hypothetical protein
MTTTVEMVMVVMSVMVVTKMSCWKRNDGDDNIEDVHTSDSDDDDDNDESHGDDHHDDHLSAIVCHALV